MGKLMQEQFRIANAIVS